MPEQGHKQGPSLVGILNTTRDSFSDGGEFLEPTAAIEQARRLVAAGADIVELGPASSHPDSEAVSADEEIARLAPVVATLSDEKIPFGVDSFQSETQRWSIAHGAQMLNDIEGFNDEALWHELAASDCELVVMHSIQKQGPATRESAGPEPMMDRVLAFFEDRLGALERAGIARSRMIADPGMGFFLGVDPGPSVEVLQGLARLRREVRCRVLVSVSRKSFLGAICAAPETGAPREVAARLPATLAAELYAARQGVDMIRTHDPQGLADALGTSLRLEGEGFFV
jgi:dihydropteroate synthase type 2